MYGERDIALCLSNGIYALKQDLKLTIDPDDRFGPKLLMSMFTKIYHPSQSKIESLKERLKKLSIETVQDKTLLSLCKMLQNLSENSR